MCWGDELWQVVAREMIGSTRVTRSVASCSGPRVVGRGRVCGCRYMFMLFFSLLFITEMTDYVCQHN